MFPIVILVRPCVAKDIEHLKYLLDIWASFLKNSPLSSVGHFFLLGNLFSWCLVIFNFLCILEANPLSHISGNEFLILYSASSLN